MHLDVRGEVARELLHLLVLRLLRRHACEQVVQRPYRQARSRRRRPTTRRRGR